MCVRFLFIYLFIYLKLYKTSTIAKPILVDKICKAKVIHKTLLLNQHFLVFYNGDIHGSNSFLQLLNYKKRKKKLHKSAQIRAHIQQLQSSSAMSCKAKQYNKSIKMRAHIQQLQSSSACQCK